MPTVPELWSRLCELCPEAKDHPAMLLDSSDTQGVAERWFYPNANFHFDTSAAHALIRDFCIGILARCEWHRTGLGFGVFYNPPVGPGWMIEAPDLTTAWLLAAIKSKE